MLLCMSVIQRNQSHCASGVSDAQPEEGFMAPAGRLLLWELLVQEIATSYRSNLLSPASGKIREIEKAGFLICH